MPTSQDQLQFLGFFRTSKESCEIIFSRRPIFTKITLALILPLSVIFLAHIQISECIFSPIVRDQPSWEEAAKDSPNYSKLSDVTSSQWTAYWLFKAAYFILCVILSLLSTSAVVYTVACIYTAKETTFRKVMKIVPQVWKRLMITFFWSFLIYMVFNFVAVILLVIVGASIGLSIVGRVIIIVILVLYLIGTLYIIIIWSLANVVSVLEDVRGIKAIKKSRCLIKGKTGVAVAVVVLLVMCFAAIELGFENFVVFSPMGIASRILIGIVFVLLLVMVILFGLVLQTVVYFVCKSYHHEVIDQAALADHLEVYLGNYVQLRKPEEVQLQPPPV